MRMPPADLLIRTESRLTDLLICFSHLRWNFVYQRPQHLLSRAASNYLVWFFEEPMFEEMEELGRLRLEPQQSGVVVIVPVLKAGSTPAEQIATQRKLLNELLAKRREARVIAWYYTPMALKFTDHLTFAACVYDCMDELAAFDFAPTELSALEHELMRRADVMFTGGHTLYQAKKDLHRNCHVFPSAVDVAHFARARSPAMNDPPDQAEIPHPRVGFFGVIDERMNTQLVGELAAARPDLQFVIIGPVVKIDPATLPRAANLHWLGAKDYSVLPEYLSGWDAAFMPFAINQATRFISPTKTPEFLSAGVPVCSTPIRDVVTPYGRDRLVEIANDAQGFSDRLDSLLVNADEVWLERVDRFLGQISWDETWARMAALIELAAADNGEPVEVETHRIPQHAGRLHV